MTETRLCPCPCKRPVKPGKTWATRGCNGRVRFPKFTHEQHMKAIRAREAKMTPAQKRRRMEIMVGEQVARRREMLMERWLQIWEDDGDPRKALTEAYRLGYNAAQHRDRRKLELEKRAAAAKAKGEQAA